MLCLMWCISNENKECKASEITKSLLKIDQRKNNQKIIFLENLWKKQQQKNGPAEGKKNGIPVKNRNIRCLIINFTFTFNDVSLFPDSSTSSSIGKEFKEFPILLISLSARFNSWRLLRPNNPYKN